MKKSGALLGLIVITLLYVIALAAVDTRNHVFVALPRLLGVFPMLMALAFVSYAVRYLRWRWLLARSGWQTAFLSGFLAYLAGFAFTATPGKAGELLRIRYYAPLGVPPTRVIAAFVYERTFDLIAVLLLATLAIGRSDIFIGCLFFVALFLTAVIVCARHPAWLGRAAARLRRWRWRRSARLLYILRSGIAGCCDWANVRDCVMALALGLVAWGLAATAFVVLLLHLDVRLPLLAALALYPLAMLAGAASMLPGGVGSTEVAIVALLAVFDVPLDRAALAAVGIRCASLWFAVLCGLGASGFLEWRGTRVEL